MKKNILFLVIIFLGIKINTYNPFYTGNDAEISYETFDAKHNLIKEDYIKYFPYYTRWVENFSRVNISKINIRRLPAPYNQLTKVLPFEYFGWYYNGEYIKKMFELNNFVNGIEIGSYFGTSTRHIASLLKRNGKLYAVDPFNVGDNHYEQFLSNIVISGLTHKIIPIKQLSSEAINFFKDLNKKFDFIYIDGDHTVEGALSDLENYYPLLSSTGVLCGDDWIWTTVRAAIVQFAQKYDLTIYADCSFWFLKKEDCGYCYKSLLSADDSAWKFGSK